MTMGRRQGLSRVQLLALVLFAALAVFCLLAYTEIARISVPFLHNPVPTQAGLRPLADLALSGSEIANAVQTAEPLTLKSSQDSCDAPASVECFETTYTSDAGDLFIQLLARFSNADRAVNFGIGMKVQQEQEQHAVEIPIPTTLENFRWLDVGSTGGTPVYYGGANEQNIGVFVTWGRSSAAISQDEALAAFSRLLDAQIMKIRTRLGGG
jgi:hypothetical protein